ncbi:hypothetical protein [Microbulbifer zhoushanensis]|nr:hypothetical protein [Microbulbifer zhoushanensis]
MKEIKKYVAYLFSAFAGATAWVASVSFLPEIAHTDPKVAAAIVTV